MSKSPRDPGRPFFLEDEGESFGGVSVANWLHISRIDATSWSVRIGMKMRVIRVDEQGRVFETREI